MAFLKVVEFHSEGRKLVLAAHLVGAQREIPDLASVRMLAERVLECDEEFLLAEELNLALIRIVVRQHLDVHYATRIARDISEMWVQAVTVNDQPPNKRAVGGVAIFDGYG